MFVFKAEKRRRLTLGPFKNDFKKSLALQRFSLRLKCQHLEPVNCLAPKLVVVNELHNITSLLREIDALHW